MEDNEKLTHYLYGHEKEMLSLWKTLVETESGPKQPTGVESVRSLLAGELAAMGFTIRLQKVSGAPDLLIADPAIWIPFFRKEKRRPALFS